ncbi:MAG: glycoside hydrolase family 16 protein [Bacteroidaceae bacterium]|nr:glycoside hydrolase family 16 protein [Bacteroidaceae bacterium]
MKKIFMLIMLCATSFVASAQITSMDEVSTDKAYTICNPFYTTYAVYNAEKSTSLVWAAGMTSSDKNIADQSYTTPLNPADPSSSWMIVQYNGEWYVYNLGAKKFLAVGHTPNQSASASAKLQDTPVAIEFTSNGNGGFHLQSHAGNLHYLCAAPQLPYPISIWSNDDNGATWQIEENPQVEADYETCLQKLQNAFPETVALKIDTRHGYVWSGKNGGAMPERIAKGRDFTFYTRARNGWNCINGLTIKHGADEYIFTNMQKGAYATEITIPADKVDGDITITGEWVRDAETKNAQLLSFSEEFDGTGEPTSQWWKRTERQGATWNRWCSNSPLVVYQQGGALHCRAIPNPDRNSDNVPMITGGVKTQGKFDFQWGRVEARIKTIPHRGTFPAFWMMPADNSKGWPNAGEIDIWETIDNGDVAYGTVHTNWTYNLNKGGNGGNMGGIDYSLWHVYAVEWNATSITWYVDGQKMWTYNKSTDQNALNNGQWPFDAPFYIILNQSVGNGSWAAPADESFTYETLFDWVRVYQKPEYTGIEDVLNEEEQVSANSSNIVYDLQGRMVQDLKAGGLYIVDGKKVVM